MVMEPRRFGPLDGDDLTEAQQAVVAEILSGPRGGQTTKVGGPFEALLRSPGLASPVQRVGEHVRFESALPRRLTELAVLMTARKWTAQFEWYAHHRMAREAGLDPAVADAIANGQRPDPIDDDALSVYRFAEQLLETGSVDDRVFVDVVDRFGEQATVDLIGTVGYYCLISFVLNVDRYPVPDGAPPLSSLPATPRH